jgi:diguanylate cyclase (GGDEF)-like protein
VREAIERAHQDGSPFPLLLMDLDDFKEVNDSLGHHAGDALLQEIASRLRSGIGERGTCARMGGDEFAVLLPGADLAGAGRVAARVRTAIGAPALIDGDALAVQASIGIALGSADARDTSELLREADIAMYRAKRNRLGVAVYQSAAPVALAVPPRPAPRVLDAAG